VTGLHTMQYDPYYPDYYPYQNDWVQPKRKNNRYLGIFIHGAIIVAVLIVFRAILNNADWFMGYMPPIGLAFFIAIYFLVEPIFLGVLNIVIIHRMCNCKGWQVGFWLNGIFLLLAFMVATQVFQTVLGLDFIYVAVIDFVMLSFPFGCIARFSNGGWKKPID
jgi:hypothetical protein